MSEAEVRAALLENGQVVEFFFERAAEKRLAGNIFKGIVENVLPGIQSAFVNTGFDKNAFLIGEGEEAFIEIIQIVSAMKGQRKGDILSELAKVVGVYIPSFYQVGYSKNGIISKIQTMNKRAFPQIQRRWLKDLDNALYPEAIPVPYISIVHDRIPLEISRGCTRGCRFCQAGMIYRPHRERSPENIVHLAEKLVTSTGYEEISLLSLSSTDHSRIEEIISNLSRRFEAKNVNISLSLIHISFFKKVSENIPPFPTKW